MNFTLRTQGFRLTEAIDAFARGQLQRSLRRFSDEVVSADVFLKDVNGPKGGEDMQVVVRVRLRGRPSIATECTRSELYAAIASCTRKTKNAVSNALHKHQRVAKQQVRDLHYAQGAVSLPQN